MRQAARCMDAHLNKDAFIIRRVTTGNGRAARKPPIRDNASMWVERGIAGYRAALKSVLLAVILVGGVILNVAVSARADSGPLRGLAGKCVDVTGAISADGTPLVLWSCHGGFNQQWELRSDRTIRGLGGKCLDVAGGNMQDGTPLILWSCHGGPNQQWELQANGTLRGLAGKCVDVAGANPADGTPLILWPCHDQPNQQWSAAQTSRNEVWGFADLHAHPASHLAFGADANGENGIFYGKPGLKLSDAQTTILDDLRACVNDIHSGGTGDPVRHHTRKTIIKTIDENQRVEGQPYPHTPNGAPNFTNWPSGLSVTHQQMHISDIRRAFDGGLRFLGASITDNQVLKVFWYNANRQYTEGLPKPNSTFDFESAIKQINFIKNLALSNADWMEVVFTPKQAREAIRNGKLAMVLGLEMDSLTLDQIVTLVEDHGVRTVIPIHLADNSFGGSAVYDDAWNTNTYFLNGKCFSVDFDPQLTFRLSKTAKKLSYVDFRMSEFDGLPIIPTYNFVELAPMNQASCPEIGHYDDHPGGHKNKNGLNKGAFQTLMRKGILLDVAHMGAKSANDVLHLAEQYGFPVMDSHTGLRDESKVSHSERHLSFSQTERLRKLGGVIGLGTTGDLIAPLPNPCDVGGRNQCISQAEEQYRSCMAEPRSDEPRVEKPGVGKPGVGDSRPKCDQPLLAARDRCDQQFCQAHSPVSSWLDGYNVALDHMGGRGVALGTDTNGLSPLFAPGSGGHVLYPFPVAREYSSPSSVVSTMDYRRIGSRIYQFHSDGLATYGMLPDFLQALNTMPGPHDPKRALKALYHSAEDTIQMWEKAEQASQKIPPSSSPTIPGNSTPIPPQPPKPPKDPGPQPCPKYAPDCVEK